MGTLQDLLEAAHALTNLGILSIQRRIHDACNKREITAVELHQLQTGFNGVRDHLTEVIDTLSRLRHGLPVNQDPEPHGSRDTFVPHPYEGAVCSQCNSRLNVNDDGRCTACGSQHDL